MVITDYTHTSTLCVDLYPVLLTVVTCADLEGGGGGARIPPPPWNFQSLISSILFEMKKIVIFHICALPQLYVKLLKVGPPPLRKNFLDPRLCKYEVLITPLWTHSYEELSFTIFDLKKVFYVVPIACDARLPVYSALI